MAFLNPILLTVGGLLIAVPVAMHLMMRQQPKHVVFPALQFLQARSIQNRRRLRLRHWLLLLLRCLAVVLLAGALARPSVNSAAFGNWLLLAGLAVLFSISSLLTVVSAVQRTNVWLTSGLGALSALFGLFAAYWGYGTYMSGASFHVGDRNAPVVAAMVFDTSWRMQYREKNQDRLEVAQGIGQWLVANLPVGSQILVVDSHSSFEVTVERNAAIKVIRALTVTGDAVPLGYLVKSALSTINQHSLDRKEIYIFSDLSESAWKETNPSLRSQLHENLEVAVYIIDVGVQTHQNLAMGDLEFDEHLAHGAQLNVGLDVSNQGVASQRTIEIFLEEPDSRRPVVVDGKIQRPRAVKRGSERVSLNAGEGRRLAFEIHGLPPGIHHGYVRALGRDNLPVDDQRHFTVQVRPAWRALIAAPTDVVTRYLTDALAPQSSPDSRFQCETVPADKLIDVDLASYALICLLDPGHLPSQVWRHLESFVRAGGGLAIFLGRNAKEIETVTVPAVLPGPLKRVWYAPEDVFFAPLENPHPIFAALGIDMTTVNWSSMPVNRHWQIDTTAQVVVYYSNNRPAMYEEALGTGRVVTLTTPISDSPHAANRPAWNQLPTALEPWYFVLVNEIADYLVQTNQSRWNYACGETVYLSPSETDRSTTYQLFTPQDNWQRINVVEGQLSFATMEGPGAYRLKPSRPATSGLGVAVNVPAKSTDLTRLEASSLDNILGPDRYQLAQGQEQIQREVGEARVGREFYPYLVIALAVILALECLLANRFYGVVSQRPDSGPPISSVKASSGSSVESGKAAVS